MKTVLHDEAMKKLPDLMKMRKSMDYFRERTGEKAVAIKESRISIFIAQNNLALSLADKLVPLIQALAPDDQTVAKIRCARQKTGSVIRQGNYMNFFYIF